MFKQLGKWWSQLKGERPIPEALWQSTLQTIPFAADLSPSELNRLRPLCESFLSDKAFHGAHGLVITDPMALSIAIQACIPLMHWGPHALSYYDDFVTVVVHPDEMLARRVSVDEAGVVVNYQELIAGEAMQGGPVTLAWSHVQGVSDEAHAGRNLVIHEFAHKIDVYGKGVDGQADGCPLLPAHFMPRVPREAAQRFWRQTLHEAYEDFVRQVQMHERFGAPAPWLDSYGAESPEEFFAVACEAYFTNPTRFAAEWGKLRQLFDAFFKPTAGH